MAPKRMMLKEREVMSGEPVAALVADGATNLIDRGIAFEGSFSSFAQIAAPRPFAPRRGLFFYSRPNNPRNTFGMSSRHRKSNLIFDMLISSIVIWAFRTMRMRIPFE